MEALARAGTSGDLCKCCRTAVLAGSGKPRLTTGDNQGSTKNTANARSLLCHRDCTQNKARRFGFYTTPGDSGSGDGARSSRSRDASDLICLPGAAPAASPARGPSPALPLAPPPQIHTGLHGARRLAPKYTPAARPSSTFLDLRPSWMARVRRVARGVSSCGARLACGAGPREVLPEVVVAC